MPSQGQVGFRTYRSRRPCPASSRCAVLDRIARQARRTDKATAQGLGMPNASPDRRLVLDLGPTKRSAPSETNFINTTRASRKPNSQAISRTRCQTTSRTSMLLRLRQYLQLHSVGEHKGRRYLGNLRTEVLSPGPEGLAPPAETR